MALLQQSVIVEDRYGTLEGRGRLRQSGDVLIVGATGHGET